MNNKFWTIAGTIIGFLSLLFAGISFYLNREKETSLEVKRVSDIELTKPLKVQGLSSTYIYNDTIPVEHLWQSSFVITNIGEQTLYGKGFPSRNIKEDVLKLHFSNTSGILVIELMDTNTDISLLHDSLLLFSQWKPHEYAEIKILSDGPLPPDIMINEYDIQNGTIIYTEYSPKEKIANQRFVDIFPYALYKALWWVIMIFDAVILLCLVIAGVKQYRQAKDKITKCVTIVIWSIVLFLMFAPLMWMF